MQGSGFRVQGFVYVDVAKGARCRALGVEYRVQGAGCRV